MFSAVFKTKGPKAWLFLQPSGGVFRLVRVVRPKDQKQRDEFPGFWKLRGGWVKTGSNMEQVVRGILIDYKLNTFVFAALPHQSFVQDESEPASSEGIFKVKAYGSRCLSNLVRPNRIPPNSKNHPRNGRFADPNFIQG